MAKTKQQRNILIGLGALVAAVVLVGVIGVITFGCNDSVVQGEVDAQDYRVASKVAGRIMELRVREGDYVKVGDTLAIIYAPELEAKRQQAESAATAATAMSQMASSGARQEQGLSAYELWQQARAGREIAEKSYHRVQRLYDEGVMTAQKRDEAFANFKAYEAQERAAQSQYDMALNGARREERQAAAAQAARAEGVVSEVASYVSETVQVSTVEGEVSSVYPVVGELVGAGSPIMSITLINDLWGVFNIREDKLKDIKVGSVVTAYCPAFSKDIEMKVFHLKDKGSYAAWKATKSTDAYDLKTFEVRARPTKTIDGLRPGMSLILK